MIFSHSDIFHNIIAYFPIYSKGTISIHCYVLVFIVLGQLTFLNSFLSIKLS